MAQGMEGRLMEEVRFVVVMGLAKFEVRSVKEAEEKEKLLASHRTDTKRKVKFQNIYRFSIEQYRANDLAKPLKIK